MADSAAASSRLYARFTGLDARKLPASEEAAHVPSLAEVVYYAYRKGFWPRVRGLAHRWRLRGCGGRFFLGRSTNILYPSRLSAGANVVIGDYVYLNCYGKRGVTLGDNVRIREWGWVQVSSHLTDPGDGLSVGDGTYIGPHSVLGAGGGISIGRDVTCGAYVQLLAEDHAFSDPQAPINEQGVTRRGIEIGDGCWLGNSVIVLDGVHIGEGAVIGAGAVVTRDVPAGAIAVGNPARVVRRRAS